MTREEAIKQIESLFEHCEAMMTSDEPVWSQDCEALKVALFALRGPTREQVEKAWRGEWEWFDETVGTPIDGYEREWGWRCSKCKTVLPDEFDNPDDSPAMRFCQCCGAPMTDEAVDMMMERLEALKDADD